jgi:Calx-beta domain/FG-GAP-like repeat
MSFHSWLQNLLSTLAPGRGQRYHRRRCSPRVATHRPIVEVLEDRLTPSFSWDYPPEDFNAHVVWAPPPPLLADFTSDGIPDKISSSSREVDVRPGRGDGTFGDPIRTLSPYTYAVAGGLMAVADFNADGRLDVATAVFVDFESPGQGSVLLGRGDGTFVWYDFYLLMNEPTSIGTGDLYGSGYTDVVFGGYDFDSQQDFAVMRNNGDWAPSPPATPNLSIDNATVMEGNAGAVSATFNVSLSAASSEAITVDYTTGDGTTTTGSDYQAASGTLTFVPGETSKTITVLVNGDRLAEPNETFVVNLSGPTNATIDAGQGAGTILDDEPRISISDVSIKEGKKNQTTLFTFTVTLSAAYDQPVTMSFSTANGTAKTSDQDYIAKSGTLNFAAGETTKTITIEVKGDSKTEATEYFYLDLFGNSSNSRFTKSRGTGTILNDD